VPGPPALEPTPVLWVALTLAVFAGARALYRRLHFFLLNPVLVSVSFLIGVLSLSRVPYPAYMEGGQIVQFFLAPAVVALGLPLYRQLRRLSRLALPILASTAAGSILGILSAVLPAALLGAPPEIIRSVAPKSVTTPIAMGVAEILGGLPSLTAAVVIATGILGAVLGPPFLKAIGVRSPTAFGLAMGCASHGIGTARALEEGEPAGAASGLAIGLNGALTALLAPWLVRLVVRVAGLP
jgi:predicted murein hydrolase (TIGR00659 family)